MPPIEHILFLVPILAVMGVGAGFLSGLLGVGGGIILVPGLYYVLTHAGVSADVAMHMAVGTSFAVIVPTGLSSVRAHCKRGAVDFALVRLMGTGVFLGVVIGTLVAARLPGAGLMVVFASALLLMALLMLADPGRWFKNAHMPKKPWPGVAGFGIGSISSLMGIGGASLSVPFMTICGVPIHRAVGSAAALGLVISVPAVIGYMLIGWGHAALPPFTIGYISALAWISITPLSVLVAPLGARVAHNVSVAWLRQYFAFFLFFIACKMFWDALAGG